ncbi:MAG: hypothetical protein CL424_14575 [Acidimicrobiaceae bacterium]|nr:hypothetical protein [Acidimicrobiaceae bacterium]
MHPPDVALSSVDLIVAEIVEDFDSDAAAWFEDQDRSAWSPEDYQAAIVAVARLVDDELTAVEDLDDEIGGGPCLS